MNKVLPGVKFPQTEEGYLMGTTKKRELLLIDPGSSDPSSSHPVGLPIVSLMMTEREKERLLRKKDSNGHSGHFAYLIKPEEAEALPIGELVYPSTGDVIQGSNHAGFGDISQFTEFSVPADIFRRFCEEGHADAALFPGSAGLNPNTCCIIRGDGEIALGIYRRAASRFLRVPNPYRVQGKHTPHDAPLAFAHYMLRDPYIRTVALSGPAGTGKSSMVLQAAFEQIIMGRFKRLLITKSTHQARGQINTGAVPGDSYKKFQDKRRAVHATLSRVREEFAHLLRPIKNDGQPKQAKKGAQTTQGPDFGIPVDILPLNDMRGDDNKYLFQFAEEAQNFIPENIYLFGTRAGLNSKVVLAGDVGQVDLPNCDGKTNGLADAIKTMAKIEGFGHVRLIECLRKGPAEDFVKAYKDRF